MKLPLFFCYNQKSFNAVWTSAISITIANICVNVLASLYTGIAGTSRVKVSINNIVKPCTLGGKNNHSHPKQDSTKFNSSFHVLLLTGILR